MELNQLKQIKVLSQTENINDASAILEISQPALTMSIQKLEAELGLSLFDRTNRKMTLNDQGRIVLESAEKILKLIDFMQYDIHYQNYQPKIKVASSVNAMLAYIIPEFNIAYRRIFLYSQLREENFLSQYLTSNIFDVVISSKDLSSDTIHCEPIFKDYVFISVPEGHRLYNNTRIFLSELNNETFVQNHSKTPSPLPVLFETLMQNAGLNFKIDMHADLISTFDTAKRSPNLIFLNSIGARFDPLDTQSRHYIPVDKSQKAYLTYYISYKKDYSNRYIDIFSDWLKKRMSEFYCGNLQKGGQKH